MIGRSVQRIFLTSSLLFGAYGFFTFKNHTLSADPVHFGLVRGFVLVSLAAIVMIRRSRISENNLLVDPEFIFATGVLFFNSIGSLFYVINGLDYLIADKSVAFLSVVIYSCSNIVSNLIYAFAIRCHQQRARFSS